MHRRGKPGHERGFSPAPGTGVQALNTLNTVSAFARREWGRLYATLRHALVTKKWRTIPLTIGAVCLTALFQLVKNNLAGKEHLAAIAAVLVVIGAEEWWRRRRRQCSRPDSRSGAPAIRS